MKFSNRWMTAVAIILLTGFATMVPVDAVLAAPTDVPVPMVPASFTAIADAARPAVVNIRTVKITKGGGRVFEHFFGPFNRRGPNPFGDEEGPKDFFGPFEEGPSRDFKQRSLGSGFIIDKAGYIVTNNHVIEGADEVTVKLANEKEFKATIVGRDPNTDLALIKIEGAKDLVPLPLGNSDTLQVGSWVVAIGSPFGLEQTVTAGIVSAKGRIIGSGPYDDFIQTDASINPGNSGGPLINMSGQVVGINTAIVASGQGIGFAIPISMAGDIISQLKTGGEVTRGWLGVGIQDLSAELKDYYKIKGDSGVLVSKVFEGDPADKAGVREGDVIVSVNGKSVSTSRELSRTVAGLDVGSKARLELLRGGKPMQKTVTLGKRDDGTLRASTGIPESREELGLQVTELKPETARRLGLEEGETGVLITEVAQGSKAEDAGIHAGDVVKEIGHEKVASLADFKRLVAKAKKADTVEMLLRRPRAGYVAVSIEN
ncbi:MAG: Do family serine endopeptidase [Pseudomonadota bacterium]